MEINKIINFVKLTHKFQKVHRMILVPGKTRRENDMEHSYQLAMLAWYIKDAGNLNLDTDLLIKYALVHDLVEVYAGDTYFYTKDKDHASSKEKREKDAQKKLKRNFPEFKELHSLIEKYEQKNDKESKFIYALDKIIPILNIYIDKGRSWKKDKVTFDMLVEKKTKKVKASKEVEDIFKQILSILRKNKKELFYQLSD